MMLNTEISYAYKIVMDPTALTVSDALILHSLGAAWSTPGCQGDCTQKQVTGNSSDLSDRRGVFLNPEGRRPHARESPTMESKLPGQ